MSEAETPFGLGQPVPAEEVGYARVSDKEDQDPDFQIALLKKRGIPEKNIFVDTASGRTMDRPKLELALKLMTGRPGWTLVVWKLDRLGRNVIDLLTLAQRFEENDWNLVSLTEQIDTRTPMGKAFFGFMAIMAQLESDLISERTKAGVARRREKGYRVGRKPKLTARQFDRLEAAILDDKDSSIDQIAKRFKVSTTTIRKYFSGWREKSAEEREAFRAENPLPKQ